MIYDIYIYVLVDSPWLTSKELISCSKRRRCSCVFSLCVARGALSRTLRRPTQRQATQEASTGSGLAEGLLAVYSLSFYIYDMYIYIYIKVYIYIYIYVSCHGLLTVY